MSARAQGGSGTLYVVATPIGNLEDLTPRAARVLREVDAIYAEDTRSVGRLVETRAAMRSLFDGNEEARVGEVLERLAGGETVAIVSEAGTPGVSDPGFRVVRAAVEAGVVVVSVPGASAAIAALVASGLPTDAFRFGGFLPKGQGDRRRALRAVIAERGTLVYYESPHRIGATLEDVEAVLGDRRVAVGRELTKVHETFYRGKASEVRAQLPEPVKGEVTLVVAGAPEPGAGDAPDGGAGAAGELERALAAALAAGASVKDAADRVAAGLGVPRKQAYRMALTLARKR